MRWSDAARVGITVAAAGVLFAFIWFATHGGNLFAAAPERLRVAFDNAQGITENAPVTLAGVPAGVVEKVEVAQIDGRQKALLTLRIDHPRKTPLPDRVRFTIVGSVLGFGTPHVEITPIEPPKPGQPGCRFRPGRSCRRPPNAPAAVRSSRASRLLHSRRSLPRRRLCSIT